MSTWKSALAGSVALGAGVFAWASLVERRWYTLRHVHAPVLPMGAPPVRVLHISDLHLMPSMEERAAWTARLGHLEPDLVISTGDNLAHAEALPLAIEAYGELLEVPGAFVLGSNDYFAPKMKNPLRYLDRSRTSSGQVAHDESEYERLPTQALARGLSEGGWVDMTNTRARLSVRGLDVALVGVDDPHLGYDEFPDDAAPGALASADLRLGLTHAPYMRVLDAMAAEGTDVVFSGHTHGGQVCVPGFGALATNCDIGRERVKGLSRWWPGCDNAPSTQAPDDAAFVHVSAGLGHSPFAPYRLACRPEATLVTLVSRTDSEPRL